MYVKDVVDRHTEGAIGCDEETAQDSCGRNVDVGVVRDRSRSGAECGDVVVADSWSRSVARISV